MSILRSMNTGSSGLRAHSEALGVVGDNISNVSTVGFKRSRAVFQDVLGRSVAGSSSMPMAGAGTKMAHIQQMWEQGALITTDAPTDLALSGDGLFVMRGNVAGIDGQYYTRAGQFQLDENGYIVNAANLRLQGYLTDPVTNVLGTTITDLRVDGGTIPALPTANITMAANLDAAALPPTGGFNPADPSASSNFSTTTTVYDSLGAAHDVTVYFVKTAPGAWDWHAMVDGGEVTGGTAGVPFQGANGTLTFNTDGSLQAETTAASSWNFVGATAAQAIAFDFGTSVAEGGTGLTGSTQFASASSVSSLRQDGFASGQIGSLAVEQDGSVVGVFGNGQRRVLGQVVVAEFASYEGLDRAGQNMWVQTDDSGEPLIGAAGSGGRAAVVGGALEGSNVDLGSEFVDMIQFQRGFSANSKIITTADEMYQELVNLKR